jgi:hypothetical protein
MRGSGMDEYGWLQKAVWIVSMKRHGPDFFVITCSPFALICAL